MGNKKAIIFDMDGTLIDSEKIFEAIAIEVFAELKIKLTKKTYSYWKGLPTKQIEYAILKEFGADFPLANFKSKFAERWDSHIRNFGINVIPGIKGLLKMLSVHNRKVSVATSTPLEAAVNSLKIAGIKLPKNRVIGGDMVKNGKPSPEIFLKAADSMQCSAHECIVVEDSIIGIEGGKRAGMTTVFVPNSTTTQGENTQGEKKWDYFASSFDERNQIIKQLLELQ